VSLKGVSNRPACYANPTAFEFADDNKNSPLRRQVARSSMQRARIVEVGAHDWPVASIPDRLVAECQADGHEIRAAVMNGDVGETI
jgi:hypothetical protein